MRKLPPLNALKAFEACARQCSFTLAAEELLVTQSAISKQVRALEDHLGVTLLLRQPRQLELTQQGKALLLSLTQVFDRLESVTTEVREKAHDLRIKLPPTFAIRWIIPRLGQFEERYPEVDLLLNTGWNPVDFAREDFDAGVVCSGDIDRYDNTVEAELIVHECLTPVCSPKLLEDRPELRKPSDLLRYTLLHSSGFVDFWEAWFESIGMNFQPTGKLQNFDLMDTAIHAAIRGFGVALAPYQYVKDDIGLGRLLMPFPKFAPAISGYYFVSPNISAVQERVRAFRRWLVGTAGADWQSYGLEGSVEQPHINPNSLASGVAV